MLGMNPFRSKKRHALIRLDGQQPIDAEIVDVDVRASKETVGKQSLEEISDEEMKESLRTLLPKPTEEGVSYHAILPYNGVFLPQKQVRGGLRMLFASTPIKSRPILVRPSGRTPLSAGLAVASLLVGQHYLEEISQNLTHLYDEVSEVSSILTGELESKVKTLALSLGTILDYKKEILHRRELRSRELTNLDAMQRDAETLLSQCTTMLERIALKEERTFSAYAHDVENADGYLRCQSVLAEVLGHIVELKYALNLGHASFDYCKGPFDRFIAEARHSREALAAYHRHHVETLGIDPEKSAYLKEGIFFKALRLVKPLRKAKMNFSAIDEDLAATINSHLGEDLYTLPSMEDAFTEDVEIVFQDGEVYRKKDEKK